jgi:hypothetical protein
VIWLTLVTHSRLLQNSIAWYLLGLMRVQLRHEQLRILGWIREQTFPVVRVAESWTSSNGGKLWTRFDRPASLLRAGPLIQLWCIGKGAWLSHVYRLAPGDVRAYPRAQLLASMQKHQPVRAFVK